MLRIKAYYIDFFFQKHRFKTFYTLFVASIFYAFCLPNPLFQDPTSMVLEDVDRNLLGARTAIDGQWRFPFSDTIPEKFEVCITEFEDRYFYYHLGINPLAFFRAVGQNVKNRKVVSGGSTLTMQVLRMARKNQARNVLQKSIEAIMATRLELGSSKSHILALYASNAPFGGNVVGLEAASWRYFGKAPALLSWAENATLAVLPNSPSLINLGKNRNALLAKRNRLLDRLEKSGKIDKTTCELAKEEPLPEKPLPLPQLAPHLLDRAYREQVQTGKNAVSRVRTTIDAAIQAQVTKIADLHHADLSERGIHNLSAMVVEVETGKIVAYLGNAPHAGQEHGEAVDIINSVRSTGSVLKPFLYAFSQQEGEILPNSLLIDVPTDLGGYHPENFNETFDGVVPARKALARSLNIPYVRLLRQYGLEKFHFNLKKLGLTTLNRPPDFYGLTLVLGGAEGKLEELTGIYASLARTAKHYYPYQGKYNAADWRMPHYLFSKTIETPKLEKQVPQLTASAAWLAIDAMKEVERPDAEGSWELFNSSKQVAWKTGTSYGFRDAWAIGITPKYAVGVWAGNADGEGKAGLVGIEVAAPLLFDIFNTLNTSNEWFDTPFDEMTKIAVCHQSGFRVSDLCTEQDTIWATKIGLKTNACPYHQIIHLDSTEQYQVSADCENPMNLKNRAWFALPPLEEYYYRPHNPTYLPPPAFRADCKAANRVNPMQLIYPKSTTKIYLPRQLDGTLGKTIFRAAHRTPETEIYWHIDNEFVGTSTLFHQIELSPTVGKHRLTLVDAEGYRLELPFEIAMQQ